MIMINIIPSFSKLDLHCTVTTYRGFTSIFSHKSSMKTVSADSLSVYLQELNPIYLFVLYERMLLLSVYLQSRFSSNLGAEVQITLIKPRLNGRF